MTKNKILLSSSVSLTLLALVTAVATAQAQMPSGKDGTRQLRADTSAEIRDGRQDQTNQETSLRNDRGQMTSVSGQDKKVTNRKMSLGKEFDARLGILTRLENLIFNSKKLTQSQKDALTAEIKTLIAQTETLKASIQNETDLQKLKDMQTQMKTLNQSFNLLNPKVSLITYADKILEISEIMLAKTTDQTTITKLNQVITDTNTDIDAIIALKVTDTDTRAQLQSYKKKLVDLQILNQVRTTINKTANPSPTVTK